MIIPRTSGLVLLALCCSGCTPEPARTQPDALNAALAEAHPGIGDQFLDHGAPLAGSKPHRMTVVGSLILRGERQTADQKVVVHRVIDRGPAGAFVLEDQRTWSDPELAPNGYSDRRLIRCDGKRLAVKRAGGPWMERETLGGHAARLLSSAYDIAPTFLEGLKPYLQFEPAGPEQSVAAQTGDFDPSPSGLEVQWFGVSLVPNAKPPAQNPEGLRALRDKESTWSRWLAGTHQPTAVQGSIARSTGEGAEVVVGALEVDGTSTVEGSSRQFTLAMRISVQPLPSEISFQLPEERLPATRDRPWQMIKEVLGDDLSGPYDRKKSAGP